MLVKVRSHAAAATTQSLMRTLLDPLAVHQPAAVISQHAAVYGLALRRPVDSQVPTRHSITNLTLQDAADVAQKVVEKLRDSFVTRKSVDVDDGVLPSLIVDDDVNPKQRDAKGLV